MNVKLETRSPTVSLILALITGFLISTAWYAFRTDSPPQRSAALPARVDDNSAFDVLIYVLDACRPDRIGYYGYELPTTPAIDALAADPDAVLYMRHYVAGNWTKPSTASLFTGSYVYQHGVSNALSEIEGGLYKTEVLADAFATLAESFRGKGYSTLGLVTSHHLDPEYGFGQGFDVYLGPEELTVGDRGRNAKLIELLSERASGYFAYVHQNACHHAFQRHARDARFMAEFGFDYDEKSRAAEAVDFTTAEILRSINDGEIQLTDEDARFLSLVYDAKLRRVDRDVVGPLIDELRRIGRWDRTLFILTADHGEELYEHRGYAHGHALWDEVIRVPLIVKFPRGRRPPGLPKRIDALTSNVDLYPSLMEFSDQPIPPGLPGRSIFNSSVSDFIMAQSPSGWAVLQGWEKLIVEEGGARLLFDLDADPRETRNLAELRPERVAALITLGEAARAGAKYAGAREIETELSPEAIKSLRALGYLN